MGAFNRSTQCAAPRAWLEGAAILLLALSSVACEGILGIESPVLRSDAASGTGPGGAGGGGGRSSGEAGQENEAGEGGQLGNGGTGNSLFILGEEKTTACPGTQAKLVLTAQGGRGPYKWEPLPAGNPGFTLNVSGTDKQQATVTGTPSAPGDYTIDAKLTDADGKAFGRPFTIRVPSVPVIDVPSVPSVCTNEIYSQLFTAQGGNSTNYQWTVDLPASSGLHVEGNELKGKFLGSASVADHLDFTLRLDDGGSCPVTPLALSLQVEADTALTCPSVVAEGTLGLPPAPPCLGSAYEQKLIARNGVGPFTWNATRTPDGLTFNKATQVISGVPGGEGTLTTQITDVGTGRTIESNFVLSPREKCWFAYVANTPSPARLRLFDAVLGQRKTLPATAVDEAVLDYRFSPDGSHLAYRVKPSAGPAVLSVVKLRTGQEQRLDFSDVTHYSWSPDSKILAVTYATNQLSGVDVSLAVGNPGIPTAIVFPKLAVLDIGFAPVTSDLVWFDGKQLGFITLFSEIGDTVIQFLNTATKVDGFANLVLHADSLFLRTAQLIPGYKGLFAVPNEGSERPWFFGTGAAVPVNHNNVIIAPSGRYTARAQAGQLALFRAIDNSLDGAPQTQLAGCGAILAWAGGKERIACARQVGDQDEIVLFDIDVTTDALSQAGVVSVGNNPHDAQQSRRRLFSPSGARFAYTSGSSLFVSGYANGTQTVVNLTAPATPSDSASAALSFSPNEQMLLFHRGTQLFFVDVPNRLAKTTLSDDLPPSSPCLENDSRSTTAGWCGAQRPNAPFMWSPGSDLAAFQNADGRLQVVDLSARKALASFKPVSVDDSCSGGCVAVGQFGFQP